MSLSGKIVIKKAGEAAEPTFPATVRVVPHVPFVLTEQPSQAGEINILDELYDAIVITNSVGGIQQCNRRTQDLTGFATDELLGLTIANLIMGVSAEVLGAIAQQLSKGRFTVLECRCARKDGSVFTAEVAVGALLLNQKRCLCFALRNISQRHETQQRLQLAMNALQSSASAVALTDPDCRIQYANPAFCRMCGLAKPEDVVGANLDSLLGADNASRVHACLESKVPWTGELAIQRPGMAAERLQVTAAPNFDAQNILVGMVLTFDTLHDAGSDAAIESRPGESATAAAPATE